MLSLFAKLYFTGGAPICANHRCWSYLCSDIHGFCFVLVIFFVSSVYMIRFFIKAGKNHLMFPLCFVLDLRYVCCLCSASACVLCRSKYINKWFWRCESDCVYTAYMRLRNCCVTHAMICFMCLLSICFHPFVCNIQYVKWGIFFTRRRNQFYTHIRVCLFQCFLLCSVL